MPYTVSTPRRFDFETRLFGLTLKQWGYMSVGVAVAGLIGLGVLIPGLPLGVRIALGLMVMAPPAAMAYLKVRGLEPEAPAIAIDREAVLATVMVLLNLMVIAILVTATWYMWDGGFKDLVHWLSRA